MLGGTEARVIRVTARRSGEVPADSSSAASAAPTPEFLAAFRAGAPEGVMDFATFMRLALYDPGVGYYRQPQRRIGYDGGTDFYTASTSGPVFGELVAAACRKLLGDRDPAGFDFVEIGAEPADTRGGGSVLAGVAHPFRVVRTIRLGEPVSLAGDCVVFSNELFDAQPFRRFVRREGGWREVGVRLASGGLAFTELPGLVEEPFLPAEAVGGYMFDAPLAAADLARAIAAQPWQGLFVAADYGRLWRELAEMMPAGSGRAYFRHTLSDDLLARPGQQDLTCHICWDWLIDALRAAGFDEPVLESQEAFFIRHAGDYIAQATAADATRATRRKLSLMQLLHPAHLGQKFQVLHAWRMPG